MINSLPTDGLMLAQRFFIGRGACASGHLVVVGLECYLTREPVTELVDGLEGWIEFLRVDCPQGSSCESEITKFEDMWVTRDTNLEAILPKSRFTWAKTGADYDSCLSLLRDHDAFQRTALQALGAQFGQLEVASVAFLPRGTTSSAHTYFGVTLIDREADGHDRWVWPGSGGRLGHKGRRGLGRKKREGLAPSVILGLSFAACRDGACDVDCGESLVGYVGNATLDEASAWAAREIMGLRNVVRLDLPDALTGSFEVQYKASGPWLA